MIFNRPLPLLFSYSMSSFALCHFTIYPKLQTSTLKKKYRSVLIICALYQALDYDTLILYLESKKSDDSRKGGYFSPIDFDDKIINFFFQAFYYIKIR